MSTSTSTLRRRGSGSEPGKGWLQSRKASVIAAGIMAIAGSVSLGTAVADTAVAGTAVAGTAVAGTAVAAPTPSQVHSAATSSEVVGVAQTSGAGFYTARNDGSVEAYGGAAALGSMAGRQLNAPLVGISSAGNGTGYWLLASDGGIFSFGDAAFYGSTGSMTLNKPVVGMASTPDGHGYWLVASDGGIFSFGDAAFYGSTGSMTLNKPVVGMASTPDGHGYWLVASDGGIFSFGDAAFYGSTGSMTLNKPVVGMASTPDGHGYWLVASDGGIFSFAAPFDGSAAGQTTAADPAVGMVTVGASGYEVALADGSVLAFTGTAQSTVAAGLRNASLWPFDSTSPWNTPLGSQAAYSASSDPQTQNLINGGGNVNAGTWSYPVVQASADDPLNTVTSQGQTYSYRIPSGATPAIGSDADLDVISPDGTTVDECWQMIQSGPTTWTCGYHVSTSLTGSGFDTGGVRADGGSSLGGLIRNGELASLSIPHALAVALGADQLRSGYVWPASAEDNNAGSSYRGQIPMGTLIAIPPTVDLSALGLSPQGLAVATALQLYGGYVADRSDSLTLYAQSSAEGPAVDAIRGDMATIVAHLRIVEDNSPATVGGPGTRLTAAAPSIG